MGSPPVARVLVLGATGTVGRDVVRALRARSDVAVRAAVRRPAGLGPDVDEATFDLDRPETFAPALRGVDALFFVSPLVPNQVAQAHALIAAARDAGVRHVVRLSSRATGWDEVCVLRRWHREIEAALVASGLGTTMLRPCSFAQNLLGPPTENARATSVFSIPLGRGRIPFVDARDLGEAAARCLCEPDAHAGRTYVLTGGEALSGDDVAALLTTALGRPIRYLPTPPERAREGGRARGMPEWLVESGLRVYARAEGGDEAEVDPTLATLLGRAPTSLAEVFARELGTSGPE